MSGEENFQGGTAALRRSSWACTGSAAERLTARLPAQYRGVVAGGTEFGQVGEKYGWLVEIDPDDPEFRPRKHTALGRFRHENITLRCKAGEHLVAYMGDDRRGGHTWKYVSSASAAPPAKAIASC